MQSTLDCMKVYYLYSEWSSTQHSFNLLHLWPVEYNVKIPKLFPRKSVQSWIYIYIYRWLRYGATWKKQNSFQSQPGYIYAALTCIFTPRGLLAQISATWEPNSQQGHRPLLSPLHPPGWFQQLILSMFCVGYDFAFFQVILPSKLGMRYYFLPLILN